MPTPCHVEALRVAAAQLIEVIDLTPAKLPAAGPELLAAIAALGPAAVAQVQAEPQRWG